MGDYVTKWGVPNWREASAYEPPDLHDELLRPWWWWQFRRRNRKVREAWTRNDNEAMRELTGIDQNDPTKNDFVIFDGRFFGDIRRLPSIEPNHDQMSSAQYLAFQFNLPSDSKNVVMIPFDLSLPFNPQIDSANKMFKILKDDRQPESNEHRLRPKEWCRFLRLIDADDDRATFGEMIYELWPPPDDEITKDPAPSEHSVANMLQRARSLTDNMTL